MLATKEKRGWQHLKLFSDLDGHYARDYGSAEEEDMPAFNVFTRRDGSMRHFWSGERAATPRTQVRIRAAHPT